LASTGGVGGRRKATGEQPVGSRASYGDAADDAVGGVHGRAG